MRAWLARLIAASGGRRRGKAAAAGRTAAGIGWVEAGLPRVGSAAASPAAAGAAAAGVADTGSAPAGFGVQRPLVGRSGSVAAFELLLPPAVERRSAAGGGAAAAAHHIALLTQATPLAAGGRPALVRLSAALLQRPAVLGAVPPGTLLQVDDLVALPPEAAAALRGGGALLGTGDGPPARDPAVDFVVLRAQPGSGTDTLLLSAQRWRETWPRLQVVALALEHLDDVERMLRGGAHLAGGVLGRSGVPVPRRELGSTAHRICELLNHLALDRDTAVIAAAVRGDVALAYRLLRYANSPAIGLQRAVETVDAAVMVLGRGELYRWLSVQLLTAAETRPASRALQESALARGRLLEGLARERGETDAAAAMFALGLLSLIEPLLQTPLAAAIAPLRLSDLTCDALLRREGPWAARLLLADAIDAGDTASVEALAVDLDVARALAGQVDAAWLWAAAISDAAVQ